MGKWIILKMFEEMFITKEEAKKGDELMQLHERCPLCGHMGFNEDCVYCREDRFQFK
jgi:hypothetical protein